MKISKVLSGLVAGCSLGAFFAATSMAQGDMRSVTQADSQTSASVIQRSRPDVGYIDPDYLGSVNVSQVVRAKDTVYFSGIVAAKGKGEPVAAGSMDGQIVSVLDTLEKLLASENMTYANLVFVTIYTTDINGFQEHMDSFTPRFDGHPPTVTLIGVDSLAAPEFLLELVAIAAEK